ncbi:hypothetical protein pEaSNUABM11_00026 [Erwinia phage pEa_SNUABM_11]|nr:hypothetical protein pEaSNUABM11_00026 [Erwinia phage pEa_SNUABM_11]
MDRIQNHQYANADIASIFYIFVSEYARDCVETVMSNKCHGVGFLTYTPPDITKSLHLIRQLVRSDVFIALNDSIHEWWATTQRADMGLLKSPELIRLADSIRESAGLNYEAFAESVKVTLEMNEIRTAFILVEV